MATLSTNLKPALVWLTGFSGAGKSTLSEALAARLREQGRMVMILDGDTLRRGLNRDLNYSTTARHENIRRTGEVAKLFVQNGFTVLAALISPFRADRDTVRGLFPAGQFIEVHIDCPLEVCETRDPKGLYRKARAGQIPEFTGISSPYEPPLSPELRIETSRHGRETCLKIVMDYLDSKVPERADIPFRYENDQECEEPILYYI